MRIEQGRTIRAGLMLLAVGAMLAAMTGCGGPRMKMISDQHFKRLAADERVDVYVGKIEPPFTEIAIIDSQAFPYVDDAIKLRMIDDLKRRARRLGANTLDDVRILAKDINGFTVDERVPFTAWKQGAYSLYFMRATALRASRTEPVNLADATPDGGWVVDGLPPASRMAAMDQPLAMPTLRRDESTSAPTVRQP
jgi:hypothetical protein